MNTNVNYSWAYLFTIGLCVALILGCAEKDNNKKAESAPPNRSLDVNVDSDTPQQLFDIMLKSQINKDYLTYAHCLAPDLQKALAGALIMETAMYIEISNRDPQTGSERPVAEDNPLSIQYYKKLEEHGLDEDTLNQMPQTLGNAGQQELTDWLGEKITNRPNFIAEMSKLRDEIGSNGLSTYMATGAKLSELEIDGNIATGTITNTFDGMEVTRPMSFKKIDGKWRAASLIQFYASLEPTP